MNMLNQIVLEGRLTSDVEVRQTTKGTKVVNFTIANNYDSKDGVLYMPCQAWAKLAEIVETHYKKGSHILVVGKMISNSFTAKDGKNITRMYLQASEIRPLYAGGKEQAPAKEHPEQKQEEKTPQYTAPEESFTTPF